jgi:hypothetical protein
LTKIGNQIERKHLRGTKEKAFLFWYVSALEKIELTRGYHAIKVKKQIWEALELHK